MYVLGRNESGGVGAGVYQRAGMLKAPAASVMKEAWYGCHWEVLGRWLRWGPLWRRWGGRVLAGTRGLGLR